MSCDFPFDGTPDMVSQWLSSHDFEGHFISHSPNAILALGIKDITIEFDDENDSIRMLELINSARKCGARTPLLRQESPLFLPVLIGCGIVFLSAFVVALWKNSENWWLRAKVTGLTIISMLTVMLTSLEEDNMHNVEACICFMWVLLNIWYASKWTWILLEIMALGVMSIFKSPLTLPYYMTLKLLISAVTFGGEMAFRCSNYTVIRYLAFFDRSPCHGMLKIDSVVVHAEGGTEPKRHHKNNAHELAYYNTFVGISLKSDVDAALQRLSQCGKCHDWSTVVSCILSMHSFLTFGLISHARWGAWLIVLGGGCLYCLGQPLGKVGYVFDMALTCYVGFDLWNISTFPSSLTKKQDVVKLSQPLKNVAVCLSGIAFHCMAPLEWKPFGTLCFFCTSMVFALVTTMLIEFSGVEKKDKSHAT